MVKYCALNTTNNWWSGIMQYGYVQFYYPFVEFLDSIIAWLEFTMAALK